MQGAQPSTHPSALFITSVPIGAQTGPVAVWVTAAGWAAGAQQVLADAWLLTPNGVFDPGYARELATSPRRNATNITDGQRAARLGAQLRWVPQEVKTFSKDVREAVRARRFRSVAFDGPWSQASLEFVWQRHDLFQDAGFLVARRFGAPLVLFVDAPVVWEARRWGVRRPGWGRLLEWTAEQPHLRRADVVACVSDEVAEEVQRFGVSSERILVTPCGVDTNVFHPQADGHAIRESFGLTDRFVVGWSGGFRSFHGLDVLLQAAHALSHQIPDLTLLFVGDGPDRPRIEALAAHYGLTNVVFTGAVPHGDMASYIAAMDVATVTAASAENFHYSPLKLAEYMACRRPVVAPRIRQGNSSSLADEATAILVEPGNELELARALEQLYRNPAARDSFGNAGYEKVLAHGTWKAQVERTRDRLASLSPTLRR